METHLENGKFYVPIIEEFYVGFEYEYNEENIHDEREWKTYAFTETDIWTWSKPPTKKSDGGLKCQWLEGNIRVKFLDEVDMLSLDYIDSPAHCATKGTIRGQIYGYDQCFTKELEGLKGVSINVNYDKQQVLIWYGNFNSYVGRTVFEGTVKNKSELKKLLSQLNIT